MSAERKDKERDKKLKVLDEIDNLRVVENNHFIIGKFKDAIKVAEDIIRLAKGAKLKFIIEEQEAFIKQIKGEKAEKDKISLIIKEFESLKRKFENLLQNNEIIIAHELINGFKQSYGKMTNLSSISSIQELFTRERDIWINFLEEQEKTKQELNKLNTRFTNFLKQKDFSSSNEILEMVKPLLKDLLDKDIKKKWEENKQEYVIKKENFDICERVDKTIEESLKLREAFIFEEAILKVDSMSLLIKDKQLIQCKNKLIETRKEIVAAEIKYNKFYLELAKFKEEYRFNRSNNFLFALLRVCEKIIHLSQVIGMKEIEEEYKKSFDEITNEIRQIELENHTKLENLLKKSKEIEKLIHIEDNILPLVEDFSVKELFGDLSDNPKEKLEQISTLFLENRVKVRKDIINKVMLKTSSGEVVESLIPREIIMDNKNEKETLYSVKSGLTNKFDDIIEDAVIKDTIPYNYKIINIILNGELIKEFPEKVLNKEGVEIKWNFNNLKPLERIDIKYNLKRRISRTIIFFIEDQLRIIKYHSNINSLNKNGLHSAKLPFTNLYGKKLNGLIIEDLIPTSYLHYIEEPMHLFPIKITDIEGGEIFRWDIDEMSEKIIKFNYKLLDKNQFEKIKSKILSLNNIGLESLSKGKLIKALAKYKEIRNEILSKIK